MYSDDVFMDVLIKIVNNKFLGSYLQDVIENEEVEYKKVGRHYHISLNNISLNVMDLMWKLQPEVTHDKNNYIYIWTLN